MLDESLRPAPLRLARVLDCTSGFTRVRAMPKLTQRRGELQQGVCSRELGSARRRGHFLHTATCSAARASCTTGSTSACKRRLALRSFCMNSVALVIAIAATTADTREATTFTASDPIQLDALAHLRPIAMLRYTCHACGNAARRVHVQNARGCRTRIVFALPGKSLSAAAPRNEVPLPTEFVTTQQVRGHTAESHALGPRGSKFQSLAAHINMSGLVLDH